MKGLTKNGSKKGSALVPALAVSGGVSLLALFIAWMMNRKTVVAVQKAIAGTDGAQTADGMSGGGTVSLRITGYWPFQAGLSATARKMEGGTNDRKGRPLSTAESFFNGKTEFVSLSGDPLIWPYGQKVLIPWVNGKTLVGRVVDTGSHFTGAGKLVRVLGSEPIDVCVESSSTPVPKIVNATIVPGDHFDKASKEVATSKLGKPSVAGIVDAYTTADFDALSRMVASERPVAPVAEKRAVAWSARNRASVFGLSVHDMLAPEGEYGPQGAAGGRTFASTRRERTSESDLIAEEVLSARELSDPTCGAIDFWVPVLQDKLRGLGEMGRAAAERGDTERAKKYGRWAGYVDGEDEVRASHEANGLCVIGVVGDVELLALRRCG